MATDRDQELRDMIARFRNAAIEFGQGDIHQHGEMIAAQTALYAALASAPAAAEPVYIQSDHLQKARRSPHLCRVEPTQRLPDFVPLYAATQPAEPAQPAPQAGAAGRVYTYRDQPGNVEAWRLGEACRKASLTPGGDPIDHGLALLRDLQDKGFGVVTIDAAQAQGESK